MINAKKKKQREPEVCRCKVFKVDLKQSDSPTFLKVSRGATSVVLCEFARNIPLQTVTWSDQNKVSGDYHSAASQKQMAVSAPWNTDGQTPLAYITSCQSTTTCEWLGQTSSCDQTGGWRQPVSHSDDSHRAPCRFSFECEACRPGWTAEAASPTDSGSTDRENDTRWSKTHNTFIKGDIFCL